MHVRGRPLRLAYFVSHPIQYQAPLLRRIAREPDIELEVFFSSDRSVRGYVDEGFRVKVEWDVPLLEGYSSHFLQRWIDDAAEPGPWRPLNHGIFRRLEQGQFDAVWSHGYSTANSLRVIASAAMLDIPVLLRAESTLHDRARSAPKRLAKKCFFRMLRPQISAVLAIGEANARYWRHYLGEDVPLFRMPYAVDNDFFQRRAAEAAPRPGGVASGTGLRGRASGPSLRLQAAASEVLRRPAGGARTRRATRPYLMIVGDGEERQKLEEQAAGDPDLRGRVRFLGFRNQTELPRYFDLCDVFVLPSRHEPWGLVVNEAMNAGRAVVVSEDVGCQQDLVREGETGAVFPAGDVRGLAKAIERVLIAPETAKRMGARGKAHIARYSFDQDVVGLREALSFCVSGFNTRGTDRGWPMGEQPL